MRLIDGLPRVPVWVTVAAWLADSQQVNTRQAHLADLAAFVLWLRVHARGMGLLAVREDVVVDYRNSLLEGSARAGVRTPGQPLAAASMARRLSSLRKFYGYAMRRAGLTANPADPEMVARPRLARVGKTPAFSREQAAAMLTAAESEDFVDRYGLAESVAVRLLLVLGPRAGEVCGLRPSSFEVSDGQLRVVLQRKHGSLSHIPVPGRRTGEPHQCAYGSRGGVGGVVVQCWSPSRLTGRLGAVLFDQRA
ncbi:tyrosine-type recombinase/integrase [Actinocorallia populi]|uniref:tyrosine-type recombinase/integrase n=1 Tax=Actinocorallia populi TaxID=2079200 RepID=UPI000D088257|nr:site-specific integrase [Actinocorallia populi]